MKTNIHFEIISTWDIYEVIKIFKITKKWGVKEKKTFQGEYYRKIFIEGRQSREVTRKTEKEKLGNMEIPKIYSMKKKNIQQY